MSNAEVNSPKGILRQQDNARVHICKIATDAVERNGYELIPHPAYSPDLAPSDYFLFPNLKKDTRGRHFRSNEEVVAAVEVGQRQGPWLLQFWADGTGTQLVQVHHSRGGLLEGDFCRLRYSFYQYLLTLGYKLNCIFL